MKNRLKYDYFKLLKFAIIIGIILGILSFAVTKYFDISRDGFFYSIISGFIVGVIIPLLLAIMNKTGIDKV
jgi:hypothetical protein